MYASDFHTLPIRQIVVSSSYICYGLRAGQVRVLSLGTGQRALLRGHASPISDIVFSGAEQEEDGVEVLASASGGDGSVCVWELREADAELQTIDAEKKMVLEVAERGNATQTFVRLAWHPQIADIIAVSAGTNVALVSLSTLLAGNDAAATPTIVEAMGVSTGNEKDLPASGGVQLLRGHEAAVSSLEFSLNGSLLASSSADGQVRLWDLEGVCVASFEPHGGKPVASVSWIHEKEGVAGIVTAGPAAKELKIWQLTAGSGGGTCVQTISFTSSSTTKGASDEVNDEDFFNHFTLLRESNLLIVANSKRQSMYTLHFTDPVDGGAPTFDYFAKFFVAMPVLNFSACVGPNAHETGSGDAESKDAVKLYCIQTAAIQQYVLETARCVPPQGEDDDEEEVESANGGVAEGGDMSDTSPELKKSENGGTGVANSETKDQSLLNDDGDAEADVAVDDEAQSAAKSKPTRNDRKKMARQKKAAEKATTKDDTSAKAEDAPPMPIPKIKIKVKQPETQVPAGGTPTSGTDTKAAAEDAPPSLLTPNELMKRAMAARDQMSGNDSPVSGAEDQATSRGLGDDPNAAAVVNTPSEQSAGRASSSSPPPPAPASAAAAAGLAASPGLSSEDMSAMFSRLLEEHTKKLELSLTSKMTTSTKQSIHQLKQQMEKERHAREEDAKEKQRRLLVAISDNINKDLPLAFHTMLRDEFAGTVVPSVTRALGEQVVPSMEAMVSSALAQTSAAVSADVGGKLESILPNLIVPLSVSMQENVRSCFESVLVPKIEAGMREMMTQFQTGWYAQMRQNNERSEAKIVELIDAFREEYRQGRAEMNKAMSALSVQQQQQQQQQATVAPGVDPTAAGVIVPQPQPVDPMSGLKHLMAEGKFDEAFNEGLSQSNIETTQWLVQNADVDTVVPKLSQSVLLVLIQQLGCDLSSFPDVRMSWISTAAVCLDPKDAFMGPYMGGILDQVLSTIRKSAPSMSPDLKNSARLLMHALTTQRSMCQ